MRMIERVREELDKLPGTAAVRQLGKGFGGEERIADGTLAVMGNARPLEAEFVSWTDAPELWVRR